MPLTLDDLRRFAVTRSLFQPTTLERALDTLGFVQADPIRAPARAQDLTLRHRVERLSSGRSGAALRSARRRRGFLRQLRLRDARRPRADASARGVRPRGPSPRRKRVEAILSFVSAQGTAHPRAGRRSLRSRVGHQLLGRLVERHDASADRHALPGTAARRAARRGHPGVRCARIDAAARGQGRPRRRGSTRWSTSSCASTRRCRPRACRTWCAGSATRVPQWQRGLTPALKRAKRRLSHAHVDGIEWYWPAGETIEAGAAPETVRLLAPFDPVVWDRRRFEILWGWAYRFEAYTPVKKRDARLLRPAAALARSRHRLGQRHGQGRRAGVGPRLRQRTTTARSRASARRSTRRLEKLRAFLGLGSPSS